MSDDQQVALLWILLRIWINLKNVFIDEYSLSCIIYFSKLRSVWSLAIEISLKIMRQGAEMMT